MIYVYIETHKTLFYVKIKDLKWNDKTEDTCSISIKLKQNDITMSAWDHNMIYILLRSYAELWFLSTYKIKVSYVHLEPHCVLKYPTCYVNIQTNTVSYKMLLPISMSTKNHILLTIKVSFVNLEQH